MSTDISVGLGRDQDSQGYGEGNVLDVLLGRIAEVTHLREVSLSKDIEPEKWLEISQRVYEHLSGDPELEAQAIIAQITTRARLESQLGRDYAVLMAIGKKDFDSGPGDKVWNYMAPEWLIGAAQKVWDHCVENSRDPKYAKYQPTLEYWSAEGMLGAGFNIVIHFPPSTAVKAVGYEELAETVIGQIPTRALLDAASGKFYSNLMSIPKQDLDTSEYHDFVVGRDLVTPGMLKGEAKKVYDFCKDKNLHPTIEYWEGENGNSAGYSIVIHWKTNEAKTETLSA